MFRGSLVGHAFWSGAALGEDFLLGDPAARRAQPRALHANFVENFVAILVGWGGVSLESLSFVHSDMRFAAKDVREC
jgi:hypothetical protein